MTYSSIANLSRRALHSILGSLLILAAGALPMQQAQAVDTELFFQDPAQLGSGVPNVLFILDTSTSMNTPITTGTSERYDPAGSYPAAMGCDANRVYWVAGGLPSDFATAGCNTGKLANQYVERASFKCPAPSLQTTGSANVSKAAQKLIVPVKQGNSIKDTLTWIGIDDFNTQPSAGSASRNAAETRCTEFPDSPAPSPNLKWSFVNSSAVTFYTGDWLNYCIATDCLNSDLVEAKRIDVIKQAVYDLVTKTSGINVGLMRFGASNNLAFDPDLPISACAPDPDYDETTGQAGTGMVLAAMQSMSSLSNVETIRKALFDDQTNFSNEQGEACSVQVFTPNGRTAMGATLYEAYQYFRGGAVETASQAIGSNYKFESVAASRNGNVYDNSFTRQVEGCSSNNVIIMLSDGTTEQDNAADGPIEKLPNFPDYTPGAPGMCDSRTNDGLDGLDPPPGSSCVDDLAQYMREIAPEQIRTYTIGFGLGDDPVGQSAEILLEQTAIRGGTQKMYRADSTAQLVDIFDTIIRQVLTDAAIFSSPTVAVNAFNRIQNLNELYIAMFKPEVQYRWKGNVKKYLLQAGFDDTCSARVTNGAGICIVDDNGNLAVDPQTGFIFDNDPPTVQSVWSDQPDGNFVTEGGAAAQIDFATRNVYTNLSGNLGVDITSASNNLSTGKNDHVIATLLGSGTNADLEAAARLLGIPVNDPAQIPKLVATDPYYDDADSSGSLSYEENLRGLANKLVDWLRNRDVSQSTDMSRMDMGDPLHSRPALVIYGGSIDPNTGIVTPDDGALYSVSNDGTMHAINPEDGTEYWSFVPRDQLLRTFLLQQNPRSAPEDRGYGLDGTVRVLRIDSSASGRPDGFIDPAIGDRVYLFFGQRRGGSYLYGMDVTYKKAPRLMWSIRAPNPTTGICPAGESCNLPGGGQTWSTPIPAKVDYTADGVVNPQYVLFAGGGYNPSIHDDLGDLNNDGIADYREWRPDNVGNRIYMLDALTGALLWSAGPSGSSATLKFPQAPQNVPMNNAFVADLRVIDLTGEGQADRIYASDLGGRVWRFDIFNGRSNTSTVEGSRLIEGGVLASLGVADALSKPTELNRRFFYAPDPSLVTIGGRTVVNVAIGSGHREFPVTDKATRDGLFSIRDFAAFTQLRTSDYPASYAIAPDSDPTGCPNCLQDVSADVTNIPVDAAGWKIVFADRPRESPSTPDTPLTGNVGEKMLAETRTFDGYIYAVSNIPVANTSVCGTVGRNSLYIVGVDSASPVPRDGSANDPLDRVEVLQQSGIAPEVVFIFPSPENPANCIGRECRPEPICLVGLESCGRGFNNAPVRTFWQQRGAN